MWKDERKLAAATAAAAIKLAKGQKPPTTGAVKTKGRGLEPAYLIPRSRSPRRTGGSCITSGSYKRSEICSGEYRKYC